MAKPIQLRVVSLPSDEAGRGIVRIDPKAIEPELGQLIAKATQAYTEKQQQPVPGPPQKSKQGLPLPQQPAEQPPQTQHPGQPQPGTVH